MAVYQNQIKKFIFKKDIFSKSSITLKKINKSELKEELNFFKSFLSDKLQLYIPKNSSATNSKNFVIKCKNKSYLLKKESKHKENIIFKKKRLRELKKIENKPFFIPLETSWDKLYSKNSYIWSLYKYFEGKHFSGKKKELIFISKNFSKINDQFQKLKIKKKSYKYFNEKDCKVVSKYEKNYRLWSQVLKIKNKKMKYIFYDYFLNEWNRIKHFKFDLNNLKKSYCHYDLHPHNIMINKNIIKIVDLNSLTFMPLEFSTAFSALKLCRQTIYFNKVKNFKNIGIYFLKNLNKKYCSKLNNDNFIYDYANAEIMRRICIILNANLNKNKSLNYILPTLISNIIESKIIFKKMRFRNLI